MSGSDHFADQWMFAKKKHTITLPPENAKEVYCMLKSARAKVEKKLAKPQDGDVIIEALREDVARLESVVTLLETLQEVYCKLESARAEITLLEKKLADAQDSDVRSPSDQIEALRKDVNDKRSEVEQLESEVERLEMERSETQQTMKLFQDDIEQKTTEEEVVRAVAVNKMEMPPPTMKRPSKLQLKTHQLS
eukprot:TRINITY_DN4352_c0_g1_i1.p1 TRINITY_DN4352_c0_g1~~TRINITY_DN4352_c0_g1_i1.p1  ORF type:complete len:193 (-),score=39.01 TRINITY_DN4352_c0_g1_i1:140-718(-)